MSGWDGAKMKYEMIIFVFFSGITGPVILYINDLVFGNVHDRRFTTCFLKKNDCKTNIIS